MSAEQPTHVVLKHKNPDVQHFAAVIPEGSTAEDVIEAFKPSGWSRAAQGELDDLLNAPVPALEPDVTDPKGK